MPAPLDGIRVLDVCQLAVGPWAASLLGQLGAEVIKVEEPRGDPIRNLLPWMNGVGTYYTAVNISKKNIALNLKDPNDLAIALELAKRADIFMENFRPGAMERVGLGYEALRKLNPRIVYCTSSGYGVKGPRRMEGSADGYARSFTGFDSFNGPEGEQPQDFRNRGHIDHLCSAVFAQAVLAGLYARERYGVAQRVDTSMMQATMVYQTTRMAEYFATGVSPQPMGSATTNLVPHQAFRTTDGFIAIGVKREEEWRALCEGLGMTGLISDRRFADNAARVEHRAALIPLLEAAFSGRSIAEWLALLEPLGVPCGPFLTFADLRDHPQVRANAMVAEVKHPWGLVAVAGVPWIFSDTPATVRPAPGMDQDRTEVLEIIQTSSPPSATEEPEGTGAGSPLTGLLVVDVSQGLAAPFTAMQLGDLGAEVIKVEPPDGDWSRRIGPPFQAGESPVFLSVNRNKKGIVLDFERNADLAALKALLARADVLVSDLPPAEASSRNLTYDDVRAINPRIIHCSVTAFGENGPLKDKPGGEIVLQAMSDVWRYLGVLGQPPLRLGADAAALAAGIFALQGVLAALTCRERQGIGQKVEVSELGSMLALETQLNAAQSNPTLSGGWHLSAPTDAPSYAPRAKDFAIDFGFVNRAENSWNTFCQALGIPDEIANDPRFATGLGRALNWDTFVPVFERYIQSMTAAGLKVLIEAHGGIALICNTYETLFSEPQVAALEMLREIDHPVLGRIKTLGLPWNLEKTPGSLRLPPPTLGEHTDEILAGLSTKVRG